MRIFYTTIIALLFSLLTAGLISAQMTDRPCCTDEQLGGAMDMSTCHCSNAVTGEVATGEVHVHSDSNTPVEAGCCASATCRGSLVPTKVAVCSPVSPAVSIAMVQIASFYQPVPLVSLGAQRTGLPPPRLLFPPVYIKNCSFLI
jgi:hypothetical protein